MAAERNRGFLSMGSSRSNDRGLRLVKTSGPNVLPSALQAWPR